MLAANQKRPLVGHLRVLVADDHAGFRDLVVQILGRDCRIVGVVADGHALLEMVSRQKVDVLIVDISMPGMNGLEAVRRLKDSGSSVRVVFLTLHDDPDYVREAASLGALGYVVKANMASRLPQAVRAAAEGRRYGIPG